ncbi:MAG TPA: SDR family NAD(P)-dependent oxidoreductase [Verrucomicrobiales bacterium]|nr:SDR family NAD(P)-dependent oxidoreductase [Verrucomicrobiales bacterium]
MATAFHSPFIDPAKEPFRKALKSVRFSGGKLPVYANVTGSSYPKAGTEAKKLLTDQLTSPVRFVDLIKSIYQDGGTYFIEAGPGNVLTGLVKSTLKGQSYRARAVDGGKGSKSGMHSLARVLAETASIGYSVNLKVWDQDFAEQVSAETETKGSSKPRLMIPVCGANKKPSKEQRPPKSAVLAQVTTVSNKPIQPETVSNKRMALDSNTGSGAKSSLRKKAANHVGSNGKTEKTVRNSSTQKGSEYASAYQVNRDPLIALQKLQQQTADLHRQFLENQQTAMESFQMLMQPQQGSFIPSAVPTENQPIARDTGDQFTPVTQTLPDPEPVGNWKPSIERTAEEVEKTVQPEVAENRNGNTALADVLLKVVADKTGYPEDMLTLEMGLDSDLGIDSIKRVEIMSALQSAYPAAPEIKPEDLGRFETLEQIVAFLSEQIPVENESGPVDSQVANVSTSLISETLLQVVSDKTGYPGEMLQLDMGLDADLGIDSIKRVEIMSALQTALPDAPEITPEELGRLNTLQEVVDYLSSGNDHQTGNSVSPSFTEAEEVLLKIVSEKTGYPLEMLNVDMGLDSDLGIDSIKRVEIMSTLQIEMPEAPEIKAEHLGQFQTIREIVNFITESLPQRKEPSSDSQPSEPESDVSEKEKAPVLNHNNTEEIRLDRQVIRTVALNGEGLDSVHRVAPDSDVWLCDDGSDLAHQVESEFKSHGYRIHRKTLEQLKSSSLPKRLSGLILMTPVTESADSFLEDSFAILKKAAPGLRKEGKRHGAILVSISRLDGHFGFGNLIGKSNPVSGGLAGLVKTANHEWPEVQCRSIDLDPEYEDIKELGRAVFQEVFRQGPVEIGISKDQICTLELNSEPLQRSSQEKPIQKGEVIVVSGGGRGVTAASAMALAKAFKPTLVLLGRSLEPEKEPDWLRSLEDEKEIKKAIATQMNGGSSLKEVERQYRHWMSNRELNRNFASMENLGATVIYRSLDIRDEKSVAAVLDEIRKKYGPLKGLIHGAGVLADRRIEDKTKDQFQQVYSTKVDGFRSLVSAIGDDPIKIMGLFSSFTGRYGRTGQVAYAAANEVLNKLAQSEARKRPDCRVVAFNWGPWNGGMVTPSLKTLFEKEGVGLIDLGAGAQFMVDELSADRDQPVEIVVMAPSRNRDDHLGKRPTEPPTDDWGKLSLETKVDMESVPCLESHIMKGKAVLPMAIMAEWMIQGALHDYPGMVFNGFKDLKVFKGILVDADESTTLQIRLGDYPQNGERTSVPVKLISTDSTGRKVIHAEAQVELSHTVAKGVKPLSALELDVDERKKDELYDGTQLFHGIHFQGIRQIIRSGAQGLHAAVLTDASPKDWMKNPLRSTWVGDPLLWDCCFQLMILWCRKFRNLPSLPTGVGGYQQFVKRIPAGIKEVIIQITAITNREIQAKMDLLNDQGKLLARIENYRCVMDASLDQAFQKNCLNPS